MRTIFRALLVGAMVGVAVPAVAQNNGFTQIRAGDYAGAERVIVKERRNAPEDTDLILNLATVYARTNRIEQARALYQAILRQPDDVMDMSGTSPVSSHALARAGLARLAPAQLTSR